MFIKYESLFKTLSFAVIHFIVGFTVVYLFTGSFAIAGGIALIEPIANTIVFYLHERVWKKFIVEGPSKTTSC